MEREAIDILSFGACLGALVRAFFGLKIDLLWCVVAGASAVHVFERGVDTAALVQLLPPHTLELAAAVYFAALLMKKIRDTPTRVGARYHPRRTV